MSTTKKTNSRCSVCSNSGHDKLQCPKLLMKRTPIIVRTQQSDIPMSTHVVSLRVDIPPPPLQHISSFSEISVKKEKRITLNFGSLVHQGNALPRFRPAVKATKKDTPHKENIPIIKESSTKKEKLSDLFAARLAGLGAALLNNRIAPVMIIILMFIMVSVPASKYVDTVRASTEEIAGISTEAFYALGLSTFSIFNSDIGGAQMSLNDALNRFHDASSLLEQRHQLLQTVGSLIPIIGSQIESRYSLLKAGQSISLANTYLLKGIEQTQNSEEVLTVRFETLIKHLRAAKPQYNSALESLANVDINTLPTEYQQSFKELKLLFGTFAQDVDDIIALSETINTVVGANGFRRYLLVTQNSAEMRATGGFWGAAAVCDFQQGEFLGCDVMGGGLYDLQGQYSKYYIPPTAMQVVNKRWECHDMNWWPDFADSANLLAQCYQDASGRSVDGVIAINGSVLERILAITGPLKSKEHNLTLDSKTALEDIQFKKEGEQPKAILGDFLLDILSYEYSNVDLLKFVVALHSAASEKEIQAFFYDKNIQERVHDFGWSGKLAEVPKGHDYLMVVNSNLLGEKSDARITQYIDHQAVINDDGSIDVTVVVKREHNGRPEEEFFGRTNLNYLRLYVPEGSTLLEAGGFRFPPEEYFLVPDNWYDVHPDVADVERQVIIDDDSGTEITKQANKTVFGNWVITDPGTTSEVYMVYRLPFKINVGESLTDRGKWSGTLFPKMKQQVSRYSVYLQKQSGINSDVRSRVIYPSYWKPIWKSNENLLLATNGATLEDQFREDKQYGIIMTERQK